MPTPTPVVPRGSGGVSKRLLAGVAAVALLLSGAGFWAYREMARPLSEAADTTGAVPGWLGATFMLDPRGQAVTAVHPGSPAEKAGLRAGDVIVAVDGRKVQDDFARYIASRGAGTTVLLEVLGKESVRRVSITLGRRPMRTPHPDHLRVLQVTNGCGFPVQFASARTSQNRFASPDEVYISGWGTLEPDKTTHFRGADFDFYLFVVDSETSGKRLTLDGSKGGQRIDGAVMFGAKRFRIVIRGKELVSATPEGATPQFVPFFGVKRGSTIELCR